MLQPTGKCFQHSAGHLRVFAGEAGQVAAVVFSYCSGGPRLHARGAGLAQYGAQLAEDCAGVHQNIEHDPVFDDFDGTFFEHVEGSTVVTLFDDGRSDFIFFTA